MMLSEKQEVDILYTIIHSNLLDNDIAKKFSVKKNDISATRRKFHILDGIGYGCQSFHNDKRATKKNLAVYVSAINSGQFHESFDKFCIKNRLSDMRKDKNDPYLGRGGNDAPIQRHKGIAIIILVIILIYIFTHI